MGCIIMTDRYAEQVFDLVNDFTNSILGLVDVVSKTDSDLPLIDKINLLLSEPLRSVGGVKDRLYKDSNGLWKIERNVGARILDGSEGWGTHKNTYNVASLLTDIRKNYEDMPNAISSHFDGVLKSGVAHMVENQINVQRSGSVFITVRETFKELREFTEWLSNNNVEIYYQLEDPYTETLDQELQDKLNSLLKDGVYFND